MVRPWRSKPAIMLRGAAEPPTSSWRKRLSSQRSGSASSASSTVIHTVGTPAVSVTRSAAIRSSTLTASSFGPGSTRPDPVSAAVKMSPHALAWNIGTTGSRVSSRESELTSGSAPTSECRTSDRCE